MQMVGSILVTLGDFENFRFLEDPLIFQKMSKVSFF